MKVTFIGSRGMPARYGGFETYVDKISRELTGHMDVYVVNPHHYKIKNNNVDGVNIVYAFDPEIYFKHRYTRAACTIFFDFFAMLVAIWNRTDAIVVCGYASGPLLFLPKLAGVKVFVNPDGFEWKSTRWNKIVLSWLRFCEWCAVKSSHTLLCDSEAIGNYFVEKFGVKVAVIEYGADYFDKKLPLPEIVKDNPSYYLACARMVPETRIPEIIDGFMKSNSEKHLYIAGPSNDPAYFEAELTARFELENVTYLGPIYEEGVLPGIRSNAMALLHGHASDGTNPSLIESMGCGSCVLAIDRESNRIPLTDKHPVFWETPDDLAELINKFEKLPCVDREFIGNGNREEIVSNFSWKKCADKHLGVLKG